MVLLSHPAILKAFGRASAPVSTIILKMNTSPTCLDSNHYEFLLFNINTETNFAINTSTKYCLVPIDVDLFEAKS